MVKKITFSFLFFLAAYVPAIQADCACKDCLCANETHCGCKDEELCKCSEKCECASMKHETDVE